MFVFIEDYENFVTEVAAVQFHFHYKVCVWGGGGGGNGLFKNVCKPAPKTPPPGVETKHPTNTGRGGRGYFLNIKDTIKTPTLFFVAYL